MSPQQSRRSRRSGKAGASAERPAQKTENEAPMERFTSLARALLTVSNKQLKEEQARCDQGKLKPRKGTIMSERPTTAILPGGKIVDAVEVPIEESLERWSELKLEDGSILRVKMAVVSVSRVQGMWDAQGNPFYMVNMSPVMAVVEAREDLRKKVN